MLIRSASIIPVFLLLACASPAQHEAYFEGR
jgi:hypothetical protein